MSTGAVNAELSKDQSDIRNLIETLHRARHDKDAEAVAAVYEHNAAIANLAPPLYHRGINIHETEAWFETWEGPIDLEAHDFAIFVTGAAAIAFGYFRLAGKKKGATDPVNFWMRTTFALSKKSGRWKIFHEHTSVPFYMDGTLRPAFDLHP
jgi:ketosteroid isomerase-like protein